FPLSWIFRRLIPPPVGLHLVRFQRVTSTTKKLDIRTRVLSTARDRDDMVERWSIRMGAIFQQGTRSRLLAFGADPASHREDLQPVDAFMAQASFARPRGVRL